MQLCKAEIVQKAIELISNSTLSNYKIAKDTGITEASIGNYRNGNTRPTLANANIIIDYFNKKELELSGSNLVINTETEYKEAMEKGLKLLPEVDFKFSGGNAELLGSTDSVKRYGIYLIVKIAKQLPKSQVIRWLRPIHPVAGLL